MSYVLSLLGVREEWVLEKCLGGDKTSFFQRRTPFGRDQNVDVDNHARKRAWLMLPFVRENLK